MTGPQKILLLKARWGHLWNKKLAYRYKLPYAGCPATNDKCPICKCHTDGASHIFAGCQNKEMKGAYIKRHDQAVKLIQRSITKGGLGGSYMIMDAGKAEDLPNSVQQKTLPDELRPTEVQLEHWRKMRPDILVIPGLKTNETPTPGTKYRITVIEVGYCSDTNHHIKIRAKEQQHTELIKALRTDGHTVTSHTITLGTTGTIHASLKTTLTDLKVDRKTQEKTTAKLHLNATTCAGHILAMRRHMEWQPVKLS
jgi:hypothetical protein